MKKRVLVSIVAGLVFFLVAAPPPFGQSYDIGPPDCPTSEVAPDPKLRDDLRLDMSLSCCCSCGGEIIGPDVVQMRPLEPVDYRVTLDTNCKTWNAYLDENGNLVGGWEPIGFIASARPGNSEEDVTWSISWPAKVENLGQWRRIRLIPPPPSGPNEEVKVTLVFRVPMRVLCVIPYLDSSESVYNEVDTECVIQKEITLTSKCDDVAVEISRLESEIGVQEERLDSLPDLQRANEMDRQAAYARWKESSDGLLQTRSDARDARDQAVEQSEQEWSQIANAALSDRDKAIRAARQELAKLRPELSSTATLLVKCKEALSDAQGALRKQQRVLREFDRAIESLGEQLRKLTLQSRFINFVETHTPPRDYSKWTREQLEAFASQFAGDFGFNPRGTRAHLILIVRVWYERMRVGTILRIAEASVKLGKLVALIPSLGATGGPSLIGLVLEYVYSVHGKEALGLLVGEDLPSVADAWETYSQEHLKDMSRNESVAWLKGLKQAMWEGRQQADKRLAGLEALVSLGNSAVEAQNDKREALVTSIEGLEKVILDAEDAYVRLTTHAERDYKQKLAEAQAECVQVISAAENEEQRLREETDQLDQAGEALSKEASLLEMRLFELKEQKRQLEKVFREECVVVMD